jgi:carboxypeptidase C (cathepsin A)
VDVNTSNSHAWLWESCNDSGAPLDSNVPNTSDVSLPSLVKPYLSIARIFTRTLKSVLTTYPFLLQIIPSIISKNVSVVLYDGDRDFIVHYVGMERVISNMTWGLSNTMGFQSDSRDWVAPTKSNSQPSGLVWGPREGLRYIRIFKSGHEVIYVHSFCII